MSARYNIWLSIFVKCKKETPHLTSPLGGEAKCSFTFHVLPASTTAPVTSTLTKAIGSSTFHPNDKN